MEQAIKVANFPRAARLMQSLHPGRKHIEGGGWALDLEAYEHFKDRDPKAAMTFAMRLGGDPGQETIYRIRIPYPQRTTAAHWASS